MKKFNDWLGGKMANSLSSMPMFYAICILVAAPLIWQRPQGVVGWMQYGISVFFQGAALPVLGYVSDQVGQRQEKLLKETHDAVMEEMSMIKREVVLLGEEHKITRQLIKDKGGNSRG